MPSLLPNNFPSQPYCTVAQTARDLLTNPFLPHHPSPRHNSRFWSITLAIPFIPTYCLYVDSIFRPCCWSCLSLPNREKTRITILLRIYKVFTLPDLPPESWGLACLSSHPYRTTLNIGYRSATSQSAYPFWSEVLASFITFPRDLYHVSNHHAVHTAATAEHRHTVAGPVGRGVPWISDHSASFPNSIWPTRRSHCLVQYSHRIRKADRSALLVWWKKHHQCQGRCRGGGYKLAHDPSELELELVKTRSPSDGNVSATHVFYFRTFCLTLGFFDPNMRDSFIIIIIFAPKNSPSQFARIDSLQYPLFYPTMVFCDYVSSLCTWTSCSVRY